jgi:hypothetical protein
MNCNTFHRQGAKDARKAKIGSNTIYRGSAETPRIKPLRLHGFLRALRLHQALTSAHARVHGAPSRFPGVGLFIGLRHNLAIVNYRSNRVTGQLVNFYMDVFEGFLRVSAVNPAFSDFINFKIACKIELKKI